METKTLKSIQVLAKIGKILSKIVFIFSIVGFVGCAIGLACIAAGLEGTFTISGITFHSLVESGSDTSIGTIYASTIIGLIMCAGEIAIAKLAYLYFKHELADGTPFTFGGAKEMMRLGICVAAISLGCVILSGIAYGVVNELFDNVKDMNLDDSLQQINLGITFIIVSLILKHGTEVIENNKEKTLTAND